MLARALLETGEPTEAHERLAQARSTLTANRALRHDPELILAAVETLARVGSGDDALFRELLEELTTAARTHAVVVLPGALLQTAWLDFESGRWTDASLNFFEAARLADEIGQGRERTAALAGNALIDTLRGRAATEPADGRRATRASSGSPPSAPATATLRSRSSRGRPRIRRFAACPRTNSTSRRPTCARAEGKTPCQQRRSSAAATRRGPRRCSTAARRGPTRSSSSPSSRSCWRESGSTSASTSAARAHGSKPARS